VIDGSSGVFTWTPTASEPGVYPFAVRVSDGIAHTDTPITITVTVAPIADLAATPVKSGNDTDGTTKILLTWSAVPSGHTVEVYRAGFGGYPLYDDGGGSVPATPTYPPAAPWTLTSVTAPGTSDEPATRDFYYYVAFVHGGTNVSVASNPTAGTLDYFLGDVSDGATAGQGDNAVNTIDLSLLGAHYGIEGAEASPFAYLDVGPTSDYSTDALPTTDGVIDFEDLIVFAIGVDAVSGPARPALALRAPRAAAAPAQAVAGTSVTLDASAHATVGDTILCPISLSATGMLKGLSVRLAWDPARVRPLAMAPGAAIVGAGGVVLSPRPGVVDAAFIGTRGFQGEGVLATMSFVTLAAGDPGIRVVTVDGRDAANRKLAVPVVFHPPAPITPSATAFGPAAPNPFQRSTTLAFDLARGGRAELVLYSVDGRRVRTLVDDVREPGHYDIVWDGRDDGGAAVGPGVYYARFVAGARTFTRTLVLLR
jgi:hypothetical protein